MSDVKTVVAKKVSDALAEVAADPTNSLQAKDVGVTTSEVIKKVGPLVEHVLSAENWWESRANWAAILSVIASLSIVQSIVTKITGWELGPIDPDIIDALSVLLTLVAGFLARRARTATKPLFK